MLVSVTDQTLTDLRAALPAAALRPVEPRHLEEPRGTYHGQAAIVAAPGTVDEVATLLRLANAARVPVVPLGGGTGLVGGQVAPEGPTPILLSLERMNKIRGIYPTENILIAEAGAILADVQAAAAGVDRLFPLSLASEGSARIGGLLGTNAGGINVLRYGNARELCLGLEAVLPNGDIWRGLKRLRKDNTGYDLRNLMIGSEGTLGVITAATLRLFAPPRAVGTAIFVVKGPQDALDLLALARTTVGESISAFELMSGQGLRFLADKLPQVRQPFEAPPNWIVLTELGVSEGMDPLAALEAIFADAFEAGLVTDGLIAQSDAQRQDFWTIRESIPEANRLTGAIASHDISLPLSSVPTFIAEADALFDAWKPCRINCFGHMGDGNLHYNIFPAAGESKADRVQDKEEVQTMVHDLVHKMDGSISAEHGIGRLKAADLERYGDPVKLAAMRAIKTALDPNGIMNPGAVLRRTATN